jgi:IS5 family transposase
MASQSKVGTVGFERYAKTTRRAAFLDEMDRVVPWSALCALIEPFYPKQGNGRPPIGVERMLRIYFLQQWFNLSDPAVEEALYDSQAMRRFVGIDLGREPVPDETVCRFRHLLETHDLGPAAVRRGTAAPCSQGAEGGHRHDCRCDHYHYGRCDHYQCAIFDQECRQGARSRDASDQEGQPVVLWDEGTFRGRQPQQADPRGDGDASQCRRQCGVARSVAWARDPRVG